MRFATDRLRDMRWLTATTTVALMGSFVVVSATQNVSVAKPTTSLNLHTVSLITHTAVPLGLPPGVVIGTRAAVKAKVFSRPSWWRGTCDVAHWDAVALHYGWHGHAYPLGAKYLGIPVCGPRPGFHGAPEVLWSFSGWGYPEWQCTELAFRFMKQVYGVNPYGAAGGTVVSLYRRSRGGGLVVIRNGTRGKSPQPGDIISFTGSGYQGRIYGGHAAVVAATSVNRYGNGTLKLLSQNDSANGWHYVAVRHWRVQSLNSGGVMPAWGWLHDPHNRGRA